MQQEDRVNVNGLLIYPFTSEEELFEFLDSKKTMLVAINAKKIKLANDELRKIVNDNTGYVDGFGAEIALRRKGVKNAIKIPGCELWLKIIDHYKEDKSFYLVGGKQEVIEVVVDKLHKDYPNVNIVGWRNGYLKTAEERESLLDDIAAKKPDVVFVAMGSPVQEYMMLDMQKRHQAIYQGLGGSFDVYTGTVRRAPKWISDHGLEGAYRTIQSPRKRLGAVKSDMGFLFKVIFGKY